MQPPTEVPPDRSGWKTERKSPEKLKRRERGWRERERVEREREGGEREGGEREGGEREREREQDV